jgi:hypothetical protein
MRSLNVINRKSLHNPKPMATVAAAYIIGQAMVDASGE